MCIHRTFTYFVYQNDEMKVGFSVEKGKTFELGSIISLTMSISYRYIYDTNLF